MPSPGPGSARAFTSSMLDWETRRNCDSLASDKACVGSAGPTRPPGLDAARVNLHSRRISGFCRTSRQVTPTTAEIHCAAASPQSSPSTLSLHTRTKRADFLSLPFSVSKVALVDAWSRGSTNGSAESARRVRVRDSKSMLGCTRQSLAFCFCEMHDPWTLITIQVRSNLEHTPTRVSTNLEAALRGGGVLEALFINLPRVHFKRPA